MKNGMLIWNGLLTILLGYLLVSHLNKGNSKEAMPKVVSADSLAVNKSFRVAYFEMDSIASNFNMVKDLKAEMSKREDAISRELDRMGKNLQQKYGYYQNKAQQGSLNETQSQAAAQEIKALDEQMKNKKMELDQDYGDFVSKRQAEIQTKIEGFLKEYNKTKGYSYIVSYEPGLFYYKDTVYNITADVVKGLNEEYKPKKN
jgi:outer membrane protein